MNKNTALWGTLAGFGAGAAAMYFLDPDRGARRRALVKDKVNSKALKASRAVSGKAEDLKNRGYGMVMEAKGMIGMNQSEESHDDPQTRTGQSSMAEDSTQTH